MPVTRAALESRPLRVASVPNAFGRRGGCYVRGYTDRELERLVHTATLGGQVNGQRLKHAQLALVLLRGPEPDAPRLFGDEPYPTRDQVKQAGQLPPGGIDPLVEVSDGLAAWSIEAKLALLGGETGLPASEDAAIAPDATEVCLPELDSLFGDELAVVPADVFGELGEVFVREYGAAELARWEVVAVRGRSATPRRMRWAKLAACLLTGPNADSPRLIGEGEKVTGDDLAWIAEHIWTGELMRLERMADALSGWTAEIESTLADELPLAATADPSSDGASTDASSGAGVSTVSAEPPTS